MTLLSKELLKNSGRLMQYRPEIGHALANFADAAVLSFKYRFAQFQQVPAGSDYLSFRSILHKSLQGIFVYIGER